MMKNEQNLDKILAKVCRQKVQKIQSIHRNRPKIINI